MENTGSGLSPPAPPAPMGTWPRWRVHTSPRRRLCRGWAENPIILLVGRRLIFPLIQFAPICPRPRCYKPLWPQMGLHRACAGARGGTPRLRAGALRGARATSAARSPCPRPVPVPPPPVRGTQGTMSHTATRSRHDARCQELVWVQNAGFVLLSIFTAAGCSDGSSSAGGETGNGCTTARPATR